MPEIRSSPKMELTIHIARTDLDIEQIRGLFQEYWTQFGFTPCFQGFGGEVAGLPGKYAEPEGRLGLALLDGRPAGCVAFRKIDSGTCEIKRLYVRPEARGSGAGRRLLDWAVDQARLAGYRTMVGDTLPVMEAALRLYDRYGFERTGPYTADPTPGAVFIRLFLTR